MDKKTDTPKRPSIRLDEWQIDALKPHRRLLLCTGRQVGKTTIMARKAGEYMVNNPDCDIIVVSLTEDQAQLMIVMILTYLEKNHKNMIGKGKYKPTKSRVYLKNKSKVLARPVGNTGDAVRGFTGDVLIVDEASRMPRDMWKASKPTLLTTGGEIWMCSTPHGKEGYFYECFQNKKDRWKVLHISSEKAIQKRKISESWTKLQRKEGLLLLEEEKDEMTTNEYAQEYLGLFIDDLRRFFSDELINKCCILKRKPRRHNESNYMGSDIARMGEDEGTYEIFDRISDKNIEQVENIVTTKQLTTETEDRHIQLCELWKLKKMFIDAGSGSLGVGILDHLLRNEKTRRIVEAIDNKKRVIDRFGKESGKLTGEDLFDNLKALMERGYLKLLDDDNIKQSLAGLQEDIIIKEGEKTKRKIFGRGDHIAEGIKRGAICSREKNLNMWIRSIKI